ncbi:hypothetical protein GUJ93_ZPchr0011g28571 [Zizania palustris]|uniref:Uncharacterized protein n=1 Tax=Zizania palustris TaxID=103762 RepID=A0A8J6BPH2_ZIZPA|nr:hypothetical protein GUJ93_ZPchr0011g28571 [Zizania palustris]
MAAMDDSCRRAGAIPFKWEICPGTPKHTRSASAAAAVGPAPASSAKVAPKLALPPYLASPSASPSPYYHSPRVSAARSASVSPSRRRYGGGAYPSRPTAFLDLAPRAAHYGAAGAREADDEKAPPPPPYSCFPAFPLPLLRRKASSKKGGGCSSGSGSSSSSFRSEGDPRGLRRTASTSTSSSPFSLPRSRNRRFAEGREEVEAAPGWFF